MPHIAFWQNSSVMVSYFQFWSSSTSIVARPVIWTVPTSSKYNARNTICATMFAVFFLYLLSQMWTSVPSLHYVEQTLSALILKALSHVHVCLASRAMWMPPCEWAVSVRRLNDCHTASVWYRLQSAWIVLANKFLLSMKLAFKGISTMLIMFR